ncbi:MAG: restriction endonuclease subunit S, partial [Clostridia bacterium]
SRIANCDMDRVPVTDKEYENNRIQKGDLLFARQSLVLEGAGKCCIVIDVQEPTVFESHLIRVRIDKSKANPYFVYYYFNSWVGRENMKTIVEQVAAAGIRGSDLVRLMIPFPDLPTQNRIVDVLMSIDEKIDLNRKINHHLEPGRSATESSPDIRRGSRLSRRRANLSDSWRLFSIWSTSGAISAENPSRIASVGTTVGK